MKADIERTLEAQIAPWLEHMRWRADFLKWRERRVWQENYQADMLADVQRHAGQAARALDLGAGMGGFAVALARANRAVVALDYNPAYCAITRTRARRYDLDLPALVGAGEALPFAADSFDLLTCWDVVEHVQAPVKLLSEIARVLEPNGVAFITVINRFALVDPHYHLRFINWLPRALAGKYIVWRQRAKATPLRDRQKLSEMHYFTYGAFARLAARCGFTVRDLNERRSRFQRLPKPIAAALYRLWRTCGMGTYRLVLTRRAEAPRIAEGPVERRVRGDKAAKVSLPIKVALFNVTTTTQFGGLESYVWETAARLPAHNVEVDIFGGNGALARNLPPSVRVRKFPYLPRGILRRIPLVRRNLTLIKLIERLSFGIFALPSLMRGRYDIIHILKPYDLPLTALAKTLSGAKLLLGCQGTDYFWGDRLFARWVDGSVACSRFNAQQVAEHFPFLPIVVFNGYDPARFKPQSRDENLRARYAAPGDALLLYSGRLVKWKGVNYLLDALARLDANARLVIAGDGEERARLEHQARALNLGARVFFLGRVEQDDLPRYYAACDFVVLPSLTHETFSIVACEALGCERAVIGTHVGGIPELVEELVPPGDAAALAQKIRAFIADPARRAQVAHRGHAKVASFLTWEATTARVVSVYRRMMQGESAFVKTANGDIWYVTYP